MSVALVCSRSCRCAPLAHQPGLLHRAPHTIQRNGADHAVFINTAQEFDGSDSGYVQRGAGWTGHGPPRDQGAGQMAVPSSHGASTSHPGSARPDEAISWGKIRIDAKPVKVYGEASMLFPLLVAQTFAKRKTR